MPLPPHIAQERWFLVKPEGWSALTPDNRSLTFGRDHDDEDSFTTQEAMERSIGRHHLWLPEDYYEGVTVIVELKEPHRAAVRIDILPWLDTLPFAEVERLRDDYARLYRRAPEILRGLHEFGNPSLLRAVAGHDPDEVLPRLGIHVADVLVTRRGLEAYVATHSQWLEPGGRLAGGASGAEDPFP